MSYWWVNQNQTAKHEIGGSYLWSPKRNRNDSYNQFYENMRLAEPGDVVFSFYDQRIQHLGIVQSRAVTAPKPTEFAGAGDYWNEGLACPGPVAGSAATISSEGYHFRTKALASS